jgi:hypothetical protein
LKPCLACLCLAASRVIFACWLFFERHKSIFDTVFIYLIYIYCIKFYLICQVKNESIPKMDTFLKKLPDLH